MKKIKQIAEAAVMLSTLGLIGFVGGIEHGAPARAACIGIAASVCILVLSVLICRKLEV